MMIPPLINCALDSISLRWDNASSKLAEAPGVTAFPGKIGDIDQTSYVSVVPTYMSVVLALVASGYRKNVDLFGLPWDWRFGALQPDELWDGIRAFIEKSVADPGERFVLIGHSLGCSLIQRFLMTKVTPAWRSKHIESVVMIAHANGGSSVAFSMLYTKKLPFLSILGESPDFVTFLGGTLSCFPNSVVFKDSVVFVDADGRTVTGADGGSILRTRGKLPGDAAKAFALFEPLFTAEPEPIDIPTAIIYNSGLRTTLGMNRSKTLFSGGDLLVNREGPQYLCQNWKSVTYCVDLNSSSIRANHLGLLLLTKTTDFIVKHTISSEWHRDPN
jgi:pimeloyl-ACP methyl ester carboxylesterase